MVFTVLGLPCDCSLVSALPHLVRKIHLVIAGHHLRSVRRGDLWPAVLCDLRINNVPEHFGDFWEKTEPESLVPGEYVMSKL